jgi:hypothetical protein
MTESPDFSAPQIERGTARELKQNATIYASAPRVNGDVRYFYGLIIWRFAGHNKAGSAGRGRLAHLT